MPISALLAFLSHYIVRYNYHSVIAKTCEFLRNAINGLMSVDFTVLRHKTFPFYVILSQKIHEKINDLLLGLQTNRFSSDVNCHVATLVYRNIALRLNIVHIFSLRLSFSDKLISCIFKL